MQTGIEDGHANVPPQRVVSAVAAPPPVLGRLPPPPPGAPGPPGPAPAYPVRRNGFATASLVLGLLGFFAVTAVLAVIFGHVALASIKRSHGWQRGTGMALAGTVLGWAYLGIFALALAAGPTT